MDDDKKKPRGGKTGPGAGRKPGGERRDGPARPFAKRGGKPGEARADRPGPDRRRDERPAGDGERKPFRKPDGERKPYGKPGGDKPYVKRDGKPAADGERKPYRKPDGDRPFARPDGERKSYGKPAGDRPYAKRDGKPAADGERKPYRKPDGDRPFARPDGERKPYGKPGGDRPYTKRDGKPAGDGERKPYRKPDGERPFAGPDGERKPYGKPGGDRPYTKRDGKPGEARAERPRRDVARDDRPAGDGERKPFRKPDGDRPFRKPDGDRKAHGKPGGDRARPNAGHERKPERSAPQDAPRPGRRERAVEADPATATGEGERIARRLARAGVASRRDAEEMIAAGRVTLNGKVLDSPAVNVVARDRITVDGQQIPETERTRLFLFHKPAGLVTTNRDPEGRRTVFDVLPAGLPRLMTVGRLDINTEGLLLMTNDGGLARVLELPATGWLRRYRVRVHGKVELSALEALKDGVAVDGVFYGAVEATLDREQGSNAWLTIGLREGKNREVKNILGSLGLDVTRLIRISYGPFQLGELAEGEVRELKGRLLRDQLGERLIEESGADFEAPVLNEFSNKPVRAERPRDDQPERPINRKRDREEKREDALGRLDTRAPRTGKPGGKKPFDKDGKGGKPAGKFGAKGDRDERPAEKPRSRTANVWMAPGARPMGEKKAAEVAARSEGRRYAGKPRPATGPKGGGGRPGTGGKPPRKPGGDR